jgi:hypothetical protein
MANNTLASMDIESHVKKIICVLKEVVVIALQSGFPQSSFLVQEHIKYLKRIQEAKSRAGYIRYVSKKLFPNVESYETRTVNLLVKYKGKDALIRKFEELYALYFNIPNNPPKYTVTENEAEDILAKLLNDG